MQRDDTVGSIILKMMINATDSGWRREKEHVGCYRARGLDVTVEVRESVRQSEAH